MPFWFGLGLPDRPQSPPPLAVPLPRFAKAVSKWLLVNIQSADTPVSDVLNREVWGRPAARDLLDTSYVLWQVEATSTDGARYLNYYPSGIPPAVAVVDPRSGERVDQRHWTKLSRHHPQNATGDLISNSVADTNARYSSIFVPRVVHVAVLTTRGALSRLAAMSDD